MGSEAALGTARKVSAFLTYMAWAANPMSAEFAAQQGVEITWAGWADLPSPLRAAAVGGVTALAGWLRYFWRRRDELT